MTESEIDAVEDAHRTRLVEAVSEQGIYRLRLQNQAGSNFMSSRQAVIAELGELARRNNRPDPGKSRSHEIHKSRLRLDRRGR